MIRIANLSLFFFVLFHYGFLIALVSLGIVVVIEKAGGKILEGVLGW